MDKKYYTWEGEEINVGDILEANDGSKGEVKMIECEICWVSETPGRNPISLEMLEGLSSKMGHTLLHKVQEAEKEPDFLTEVKSDHIKYLYRKLSGDEDKGIRYCDVLSFLMRKNYYVTVVPTVVRGGVNRKFDFFVKFKYRIVGLHKVFERKDEDGFESWVQAMEWGLDKVFKELEEEAKETE